MNRPLSLLVALVTAAISGAQVQPTTPAATDPAKASVIRRPAPPKATRTGGKVLPDPDILDGSKYEPEKRPLHGMLAEIEMGEQEGGDTSKVSPDSGPAGGQTPSADKNVGAAGAAVPKKTPAGPAAEAEGIKVADLKVPEGAPAAPESARDGTKAREMQIGDATLQIQTVGTDAPGVIGLEPSTSQQHDKRTPGGGTPTSNRNQGVEKGRIIPKGL